MKIRDALNKLVALSVHFYITLRVYWAWSKTHQAVYDRRWRGVPLDRLTMDEAAVKMRSFRWETDGISEFGDAVCSPQKVTAVGFKGQPDPNDRPKPSWCPSLLWKVVCWFLEHGNDCDEEASYLANSLCDKQVQSAEILTVSWWSPDDGYTGHNVCLIGQLGLFRYMDYGDPGHLHVTERQVADDVVRDYARGKGVLLCWHVSDKDLKPLRGEVCV